jgi:hypothetical protein
LFKKIAIEQAAKKLQELRTEVFSESAQSESPDRPPHSAETSLKDRLLPSKAYTKNVLETFPNTYTWRRLLDQTTRAALVGKLQDAKDKLSAETGSREAAFEVLRAALEVAQLDLAQDNVAGGFGILRSAEDAARSLYSASSEDDIATATPPSDAAQRQHLSQFYELLGTEAQFKSLASFALRCFRHSQQLCAQNFSVQLKLAALYSELEVESAATAIYDRLLLTSASASASVNNNTSAVEEDQADDASVNSRRSTGSFSSLTLPLGLTLDLPKLRLAWTQLHRAALLVQRQPDGAYLPDAAAKAVEALEQHVLAPLGKP